MDFMKYRNFESLFTKFSMFIFAILPLVLGLLTFLMQPDNMIFILFIVLTEISLVAGIVATIDDNHIHMLITIIGLIISTFQASFFGSKYGFQNGVVYFLIYQW